MKKIIIGLFLLSSISAFAGMNPRLIKSIHCENAESNTDLTIIKPGSLNVIKVLGLVDGNHIESEMVMEVDQALDGLRMTFNESFLLFDREARKYSYLIRVDNETSGVMFASHIIGKGKERKTVKSTAVCTVTKH